MFKKFAELFLTFAKVGAMTFGGGYAMLPILQREVVENKGWAVEEELTDSSPSPASSQASWATLTLPMPSRESACACAC